jgi:hypothetical protein
MLHRMALRVLPSLSLAVTEHSVRKKKRIIMFVPGLVAFAVYRVAKLLLPLSEPIVLLVVSGLVSLVTALLAYRVGRATGWGKILREDGARLLTWLGGWIGFVYGVQLSLLVLALLWLVGYDYLKHPDGPAMMAIIIACTSVARDAFEVGHVRKMALTGRPFPTFPNGAALRTMVGNHAMEFGPWVAVGLVVGALGASLGHFVGASQGAALVQLSAVALLGGGVALCAYFGGLRSRSSWIHGLLETKAGELLKYWWWPGLSFTATYYLVAAGCVIFLFRQPGIPTAYAMAVGGFVTGMMALYCYYLGFRRELEEQQGHTMSSALLRCPFVMGILGKSTGAGVSMTAGSSPKV